MEIVAASWPDNECAGPWAGSGLALRNERSNHRPPGRNQGRQKGIREPRLACLSRRSGLGPAAEGRGPRPHHTGQESVVRARQGQILAGGARWQGRRPDQRAGRRAGAGAYGRGHRPVGNARNHRRRSGRRADRHRRGLAPRAGHDHRDGPDQPFNLGRAGARDRGFRPAADRDDGSSQARISAVDRSRRLRKGQGPAHLRSRYRQLVGRAHRPSHRFGREEQAHPHAQG